MTNPKNQADADRLKTAEVTANWLNALFAQEDYEGLKAGLLDAISQRPHSSSLYNNLGITYGYLKQYDNAEHAFTKAIALNPDYLQAYKDRGLLYDRTHQNEQGLSDLRHYLSHRPEDGDAWGKLGLLYLRRAEYDLCRAAFDRASVLSPNVLNHRFNVSILDLLMGDLKRGFQGYEYRWHNSGMLKSPTQEVKIQLDQSPIAELSSLDQVKGAKILCMNEQGIGDSLQFARFLPLLKQKGARLSFSLYGGFESLLSYFEAFDCLDQVGLKLKRLEGYDYYCSIGSFGKVFNITGPADIPPPFAPAAPDELLQKWKQILDRTLPAAAAKQIRIVIAPFGNPGHPNDHARSASIHDFEPLFKQYKQAQFILINPESDAQTISCCALYDHVHYLGDQVNDFMDSAAILHHCDLVISVDTSLLHLAGSMNKPVFGLLAHVPDWRWQLGTPTSPWYPALTLFRKAKASSWENTLRAVSKTLQQFIDGA